MEPRETDERSEPERLNRRIFKMRDTGMPLTIPNVERKDEEEESSFGGIPTQGLCDLYFDQKPSRKRELLREAHFAMLLQCGLLDRGIRAIEAEMEENTGPQIVAGLSVDSRVEEGLWLSAMSPTEASTFDGYWLDDPVLTSENSEV